MTIKVLIAEELMLLREAIAREISDDERFQLVRTLPDNRGLIEVAEHTRPHVAVLDIVDHEAGSLMALRRLGTLPIVYTAREQPDHLITAAQQGACGFVCKRGSFQDLATAIVAVHAGQRPMDPRVAGMAVLELLSRSTVRSHDGTLTPAEADILRRVATGKTDRQIANEIYVSPRTVQNELAKIRRKTGLHRRSELTRWAVENACI